MNTSLNRQIGNKQVNFKNKFSKKTILVADDDRFMRYFFRNILVRAGYCVKFADTGSETIKQMLLGKIDAVILDIHKYY